MNKTIIININGTVFHIEEQAYEILKRYMTGIKRHFFDSEDSLEITTDIENRIAELFTEILHREDRQAIIDQDVDFVIEQMGAVEDFEGAAAEGGASAGYTYSGSPEKRRLFRDADDHLVAGVCAGIANYFDTQPVWIRLAFAVSTLFAGTGLFLYVVLWIVLPQAVTRADRMAMKGEKLDLQGFKKNFEAELHNVKGRLHEARHEAQPFIYRFRDFVREFFTFTGSFISQSSKLILKLIGFAFMLAFFSMAIALIVMLIMVIGFNQDLHLMFPFNIIGNRYEVWLYLSAFTAALVPLLVLILVLAKLVFNTRSINRSTSSTLLVVWICAISIFVYFATKVASGFKSSASFDETINVKPSTAPNTYYLKLDNTRFFTAEDSARLDIQSKFHGLVVTNDDEDSDEQEPRNVSIYVEKSEDVTKPVLVERYRSKGPDYERALFNARNTRYNFTQKDSVLTFDYKLHRLNAEAWHGEEIELTLKVPLNTNLVVDRSLNNYMHINIYDCASTNKKPDATNARFIMTDNGLQCKVDTLKTDTIKVNTNAKKF
jgi:phage shock protein PspC (stress-responsive transcriptional regulator)